MSPFSRLILFILALSLFFLVNLARGLSILLYPFKEPALCFIYFLTLSYLFFKLCYFLPSANFRFRFFFPFLILLGGRLGCLRFLRKKSLF